MKNASILNSKKLIYLHFKVLDRTVYIGLKTLIKTILRYFSSKSTNETIKRKEKQIFKKF